MNSVPDNDPCNLVPNFANSNIISISCNSNQVFVDCNTNISNETVPVDIEFICVDSVDGSESHCDINNLNNEKDLLDKSEISYSDILSNNMQVNKNGSPETVPLLDLTNIIQIQSDDHNKNEDTNNDLTNVQPTDCTQKTNIISLASLNTLPDNLNVIKNDITDSREKPVNDEKESFISENIEKKNTGKSPFVIVNVKYIHVLNNLLFLILNFAF